MEWDYSGRKGRDGVTQEHLEKKSVARNMASRL